MKDVIFITSGNTRLKVFNALRKPKNPATVIRTTRLHRSAIARSIADLLKAKLIKKNRREGSKTTIYSLSTTGKKAMHQLDKYGLSG